MWFRALFLVCALAVTGCTSGIAEFQTYRVAFDEQHIESTKVFDRFAEAERTRQAKDDDGKTGIAPFDPDKAAAVLGIGDPPRTRAFRSSLSALKTYNDALAALASGEAAEALSARMGIIANNLSATAAAISGQGVEGQVGLAAVNTAVATLLPIFQRLKKLSDRAAFQRQLVDAYPDMRLLLVKLRAATPELFQAFRESYVDSDNLIDPDGISPEDLEKLEADRRLLAGWVLLIDQTLDAMDAAVAATRNGSTANVATLLEASVQVRATAEALRAIQNIPGG